MESENQHYITLRLNPSDMEERSPSESKSLQSDHQQLQVGIFLSEYQACHRTRNHYDGVRWTIGSIFIGASLAMFGFSLDKEWFAVLLAGLFSLSLMSVWYVYAQHVNPYIMASILRCHEIEKDLRTSKFRIALHKAIRKTDNSKNLQIKGTKITFSLFSLVMFIWFLRFMELLPSPLKAPTLEAIFGICILVLGYIVCEYVFWLFHKRFNAIDWGVKIDEVLKDC